MEINKVIGELKLKYPGKTVFPTETEIICEIDPSSLHPDHSLAISVCDSNLPHYHRATTETYKVIRGVLKLHFGDETVLLHEGESQIINPGIVHWAEGNETWIECYSTPGWTPSDHILGTLNQAQGEPKPDLSI